MVGIYRLGRTVFLFYLFDKTHKIYKLASWQPDCSYAPVLDEPVFFLLWHIGLPYSKSASLPGYGKNGLNRVSQSAKCNVYFIFSCVNAVMSSWLPFPLYCDLISVVSICEWRVIIGISNYWDVILVIYILYRYRCSRVQFVSEIKPSLSLTYNTCNILPCP